MKKNNLVKYILIFVLAGAAFLCGWALIGKWFRGKEFADGFKSWVDWVLAVVFAGSCAFSSWKKDNEAVKKDENQDEKKEENK